MFEQPQGEDSPGAYIERISVNPQNGTSQYLESQIKLNQAAYFTKDGNVTSTSSFNQLVELLQNNRQGLNGFELVTFLTEQEEGLVLGHLPLVSKNVEIITKSEGRAIYRFNRRIYYAVFGYSLREVIQMQEKESQRN